jgi:hypothetical protein
LGILKSETPGEAGLSRRERAAKVSILLSEMPALLFKK